MTEDAVRTVSPLTMREAIDLLKKPLEAEMSDRLAALEARIFRIERALLSLAGN